MIRGLIRAAGMLMLCSSCMADVIVGTQIAPLEGLNSQAGTVTLSVDNNIFANVSPQYPIYLRISLDHGVRLCKSLVPPSADNHDPIYLPTTLISPNADDANNMLPDAVVIARWVAGESAIWIRVSQSSREWITTQSGNVPPSATRLVSFAFGLSARVQARAAAGEEGNATITNLPYARYQSEDRPISTLLCVDLSNSNLKPLPNPMLQSVLNFDPIAFQFCTLVEVSPEQGGIGTGSHLGISFSPGTLLGRLQPEPSCTLSIAYAEEQTVAAYKGDADCQQIQAGLKLDCQGNLQPGSAASLLLTGSGSHFFALQTDGQGNPIPGEGGYLLEREGFELGSNWANPTTPFSEAEPMGEGWGSAVAQAIYQGTANNNRIHHFSASVCNLEPTASPPSFVVSMTVSNQGAVLDSAPYDAEDQALGCTQTFTTDFIHFSIDTEQLLITEIVYDDKSGEDLVELVNAGASTLNVGGWYLFNGFKYGRLSDGLSLEPGAIATIHINSSGTDSPNNWYLDQPVELGEHGEVAVFVDTQLDSPQSMRAYVQWGAPNQAHATRATQALLWQRASDYMEPVAANHSLGLLADAWAPFSGCDWADQAVPSPGETNTIDIVAAYQNQLSKWPAVDIRAFVGLTCRADLAPFQTVSKNHGVTPTGK